MIFAAASPWNRFSCAGTFCTAFFPIPPEDTMNHRPPTAVARFTRPVRAALSACAALLVLASLSVSPLTAQMPDGWEIRLDRPNMDAAEIDFRTMGDGLHATTGPAAIFWNPENSVNGDFRAEVELTQTGPTDHPESYGIFVGGENLDGEAQSYLYFLVRQDGSYLVTHRAGSETHTIQGWTPHDAVNAIGDEGGVTNALAIERDGAEVSFHVNGTQVEAYENEMMETDGIVGLRVNHQLDLHIADFDVTQR